jgi:hypothetical protein
MDPGHLTEEDAGDKASLAPIICTSAIKRACWCAFLSVDLVIGMPVDSLDQNDPAITFEKKDANGQRARRKAISQWRWARVSM